MPAKRARVGEGAGGCDEGTGGCDDGKENGPAAGSPVKVGTDAAAAWELSPFAARARAGGAGGVRGTPPGVVAPRPRLRPFGSCM